MRRLTLILVFTVVSACGSDPPTAPSTVQVAGLWSGTSQITSVSGGECVGTLLQAAVGSPSTVTAAITQTGANLTATVTSQSDGTTCTYSGTAGSSSVSFNLTSCQVGSFRVGCSNGAIRNISLFAGTLSASAGGNSLSGTSASSWNVATTLGGAVGVMTVNGSFSVTRQ